MVERKVWTVHIEEDGRGYFCTVLELEGKNFFKVKRESEAESYARYFIAEATSVEIDSFDLIMRSFV